MNDIVSFMRTALVRYLIYLELIEPLVAIVSLTMHGVRRRSINTHAYSGKLSLQWHNGEHAIIPIAETNRRYCVESCALVVN